MFLRVTCLLYLIIITFYDFRTGRIPNFITFGFFAIMLLADIFTDSSRIPKHMLSAAFFFMVFFVTELITSGIGMGDIKLASVLGYGFGVFSTSIILILSSIAGIAVFLILKISKKAKMRIPFAPLVTAGYVISELFCRRIL